MIKKLIIAILIALPFSMAAQKFGLVDAGSPLSAQCPSIPLCRLRLAKPRRNMRTSLKKLQEEYNKKLTEYQALDKDTTTPQSIKERRMSEMMELDQKIQQFHNTAMQDLQRQQQQLMAPIEQKLMDAIKSVGQEGSYTLHLPQRRGSL